MGAVDFDVRVTGQETVARAFATIVAGAEDMGPFGAQIAATATQAARSAAPSRTGWMRQTISGRSEPQGALLQVGAIYGGVIEWGWARRGIRGRHFMARGILGATQAIVAIYSTALETACAAAQRGE